MSDAEVSKWSEADAKRMRYFASRCEPDPVTGCWVWRRGARVWDTPRGISVSPYRAMAELMIGEPLSADKLVRHLCDNRACINPGHLAIGTVRQNADDSRGRRSRLSEEVWAVIFQKLAQGATMAAMAEEYGISQSAISQMKRRREEHAKAVADGRTYAPIHLTETDRGVFGSSVDPT